MFPRPFLVDVNGTPRVGAKANYYRSGTVDPIQIWTTAAYDVEHANPVLSVGGGFFPAAYIDPAVNPTFKLVVTDSSDVSIYNNDDIPALGFTAGDVGQLLHPQTEAEEAAPVTPSNYAIDVTDYSEVRRYGVLADDSTDNSTALAAAMSVLANGAPMLRMPPGMIRYSTDLNLPTTGCIVGNGKERTILRYTGSARAFKQASPGSRIFELLLCDFSLYNIGTGTVGLDLDSVSTSNFIRLWIDNFTTCVRIHSPSSGFSVYNNFEDVTGNINANQTAFLLSGTSTNSQSFRKCRANAASQTGSVGWDLSDGNGNRIMDNDMEGCGIGVKVHASGPGVTTANHVHGNRLEGNAVGVHIVSTDVEATILGPNSYTANTVDIIDGGSRTKIDEPSLAPGFQRIYSSAITSNALGNIRLVREASGGSSLPFLVVRDDAGGAGTPVTLQVETERTAGSFFRGKRGGATIVDITADGTFTIGTIKHLDGSGTPEGAVTAVVGSTFNRTDGGAGTSFYVKEVGSGATGWVGK